MVLTRPTAEADRIMETFAMTTSRTDIFPGTIFRTRMVCLATVLFALVAGYAGNANALQIERT